MATYSSILAWKIPWTEEPGRLQWGCKESDMTEQLTRSPLIISKSTGYLSLLLANLFKNFTQAPYHDNPFLSCFAYVHSTHCRYLCSVTQSRPTLWVPMDCSTPGLPVHHHLLEFAQVHVHCIGDAIQPPHPLMPSSPSSLKIFQHHRLFQ